MILSNMEYENKQGSAGGENRPIIRALDFLTQLYPLRALSRALEEEGVVRVSGPGAIILFRQLRALVEALGGALELKDALGVIGEKNEEDKGMVLTPEKGNGRQAAGRQLWLDHANAPLFDAYRQSGVAGLWLAERRKKGSELIGRQLSFGELVFSTTAYLEYRDKVQLTQKLYDKVGYLAPAFQELNAGIFRHQNLEDAQGFVERQLVEFIQSADQLHFAYARAINDHYRNRRTWYQRRFLALLAALDTLKDRHKNWAQPVSRGGREKKEQRSEQLMLAWTGLQTTHEKMDRPPFDFEWPTPDKRASPSVQETRIADYEQSLKAWNEKERIQIREEQLGLNATTDPERQSQWNDLHQRMTDLIESVNNAGLFQRPLTAAATTIPRQQKVVEHLLEKLQLLQRLLPDLPAFYRWQHHWFSLEAELRRVITPLLVTPAANWITAFSAWYFENGVANHLFGVQRIAHLPLEWRAAKEEKSLEATGSFLRLVVVTDPEQEDLGQLPNLPTLLLCESHQSPSAAQPVHYLARYGHYQPGLAFVQEWTSYDLPDWKWADELAVPEILEITEANWTKKEAAAAGIYLGRLSPEAPLESLSPAQIMGADWLELMVNIEDFSTAATGAIARELALVFPQLWACANRLRLVIPAAPDELTNALLSDGFSGPFALAATIRACEAIAENDRKAFEAMAREVRKRLGAAVSRPDPVIREILPALRSALPEVHFQAHFAWRDLFLPLMAQLPNGHKVIVLTDDLVPGADTLALDDERRRELRAAGFVLLPIFTSELMTDVEATTLRLIAGLEKA